MVPHHHYEISTAVVGWSSLVWCAALVFVERKYIRAHSFHFRFVSATKDVADGEGGSGCCHDYVSVGSQLTVCVCVCVSNYLFL